MILSFSVLRFSFLGLFFGIFGFGTTQLLFSMILILLELSKNGLFYFYLLPSLLLYLLLSRDFYLLTDLGGSGTKFTHFWWPSGNWIVSIKIYLLDFSSDLSYLVLPFLWHKERISSAEHLFFGSFSNILITIYSSRKE